jgi:hypothetical protein
LKRIRGSWWTWWRQSTMVLKILCSRIAMIVDNESREVNRSEEDEKTIEVGKVAEGQTSEDRCSYWYI